MRFILYFSQFLALTLSALTIGAGSALYAQKPFAYHITDEEGLPSNEVYDIYQTKNGYIWVATDAGLARYNGREFRSFTNVEARGKSLSYLNEDSKGRLWCANFTGQLFYALGDSLYNCSWIDTYIKSSSLNIALDKKDNLYIIPVKNIGIKQKISCINLRKINTSSRISTHFNDIIATLGNSHLDELVAMSSFTGVSILKKNGWDNLNSQTFLPKKMDEGSKRLMHLNYALIASKGGKGTYLLSDFSVPLYWYDGNKFSKHPISELLNKHNAIPHSIEDSDSNNIFVATFSGVLWCEKRGENYIEKGFLWEKDGFSKVIRDSEGNYWFATVSSRNGLYVIPNINIQHYTAPRGIFSRHLARLGNTLYLCDAQSGIFSRKANDKTWKIVTTTLFETPRDANSFVTNEATNDLWVSQANTKRISVTGQIKQVINFGFLRNMTFPSPDLLAYSEAETAGIISLKTPSSESFNALSPLFSNYNITWLKEPSKLLRNTASRAIVYNSVTNSLFVGYGDCLLRYDFITKKIDTLFDENKQHIITRSLAVDKQGKTYCGTIKDGLYIFNEKMQQIAHYTTTTHPVKLANNTISNISITDKYVWVSSNSGLQSITVNPKDSPKIGTIDKNDGLVSNEISDMEYIPESHTIWVSTPKGLQSFNEDISSDNPIPPKIYINRIAINERDTTLCQTLLVRHNQNDITIGLEGLAFRSRGNFSYHYRLLGLSDRWSVCNSNVTFVRYSSLPMGSYDFEVYTLNEDGVRSDKTATLHIEVQPPWWRTWWAYLLYIIGISTLVVSIYRWRFAVIKSETDLALRNSQIEQDLRTSQLTTLQVQMNPHFIFNALNSIQEYILLNEKRLANEFLGKFADLMRYTLDMSQQKEVPLSSEINALRLYLELENLRFDNTLLHTIEVEPIVREANLRIPSMLLQPYVENAIKHGLLHRQGKKTLIIHFNQEEQVRLICTITDNGIGRVKAFSIKQERKTGTEHRSFATTATQKRLELLNHGRNSTITVQYIDLYNAQMQATGTKVIVSIPV